MKKIILLVLGLLWILISFFTIKSTYAKYLTNLSANNNIGIAAWNIILNNQNIISNSNISSTLDLTIPETNYYKQNCLVPNAIGYFDLNLNTTNVNMPFKYTITCTPNINNNINDIKIIGYALDSQTQQITYLQNSNDIIQRTVNAQDTSSFLRVYVQWIEGPQIELLNDINDTSLALASSNNSAIIDVAITFEQIVSQN